MYNKQSFLTQNAVNFTLFFKDYTVQAIMVQEKAHIMDMFLFYFKATV